MPADWVGFTETEDFWLSAKIVGHLSDCRIFELRSHPIAL